MTYFRGFLIVTLCRITLDISLTEWYNIYTVF